MPAKTVSASIDLTERNVAVIRAALCTASEFKPDWSRMLKEYGLGKSGHGYRDFNLAIAKLGVTFKDGKFIDNIKDTSAAPPVKDANECSDATDVNSKVPRKRKRQANAGGEDDAEKKPKIENSEEGDN